MPESPGPVALLLAEPGLSHKDALDHLIPLVYAELRRLAAHYLRAGRLGHTLQPTAVLHEAYLRLLAQDRAAFHNRVQFLCVAGQLMRRILVDYARARLTAKRAARALRISPRTVKRDWAVASAWLRRQLRRPAPGASP